MGRHLVGACILLNVIGLAFQSARADDRKSAGRGQERREAVLMSPSQAFAAPRAEKVSVVVIPQSPARPLIISERSDPKGEQAHRYKSLTFFRFNSRFGEVAVKPVIGKVTGAEFALEF